MRIRRYLGISLVLAAASCGDSTSNSLTSPYSRAGQGPTGASGSTTGNTKGATGGGGGVAGSSSPGSTTSSDGGLVVSGDAGAEGRALFEALLPSFDTACGGACHQQGGASAPPYLGGSDPYTTIKTYQGMIEPTAAQSILLTKGQHEGPALVDPLKTSITNWLTVEAAVAAASGPPVTAPITVASGANTVSLSSLGVTGVSLSFSASVSGDILTLSSLEIAAPATTGIQLTYPIFYVNGAGGTQTQNDDLSNVSQTLAAGTSAALGTGLLIITGWASTDTLQILVHATRHCHRVGRRWPLGRLQVGGNVHHRRGPCNPGEHLPQLPQHRWQRKRGARPLRARRHPPRLRDCVRPGAPAYRYDEPRAESDHPCPHRRAAAAPLHERSCELRHDDGNVDPGRMTGEKGRER